jgi:biotin transporter BioY
MGASAAFAAGVVPFIAVDSVKAAIAITLAMSLRRAGVAN